VPLLDDEGVATTARIPPDLKLRRLTRKYVFKKSMEGVLPRDIIWRRKLVSAHPSARGSSATSRR
jgi:asparagine synthase (glutamine-hydrolysing)